MYYRSTTITVKRNSITFSLKILYCLKLHFITISAINFEKIGLHIIRNIEVCLLDINESNTSPPSIRKSLNFILVSVNINMAKKAVNAIIIPLLSIKVKGRCSLMFSVVFPCIVFTKYVYGTSLSGVNNPEKAASTTTTISHFIHLLFVVIILYGFCLFSCIFIFLFSFCLFNNSILSFIFVLYHNYLYLLIKS